VNPAAGPSSLLVRLPRGLLDPRLAVGFGADADGLVSLRLRVIALVYL